MGGKSAKARIIAVDAACAASVEHVAEDRAGFD